MRLSDRAFAASSRLARGICRRCLTSDDVDWSALDRELAAWEKAGRIPTFWWRDDDAVTVSPALDRLLARAAGELPLGLAVIPAHADEKLRRRLADEPHVCVLQHGWDHTDYGSGSVGAELWDTRDPDEVHRQLIAGRDRLRLMFDQRFREVLVPPNGYLALKLVPTVAATCEYVSLLGDWHGRRLPSRNVHLDLIDWRARTATNLTNVLRAVLLPLRLRRYGIVDENLPIGLCTHHLDHDEAVWALLDAVLTRLHDRVTFKPIPAIFAHRPLEPIGSAVFPQVGARRSVGQDR